MKNYIQGFLRSWKHQTAVQVATLSVLIGTYSVVALTLLVHENLEQVLGRWGSEVKVNVYLEDGVTEQAISQIKEQMNQSELFSAVNYVSKDQALSNFQKRMGSLAPALLNDEGFQNPLPSSLEAIIVKSKSQFSIEALPQLASVLLKIAGVEDVSYGQGWVENYASVLRVFRFSSWGLIFVLFMGCLLVIGNSIKSSVLQRRDEIEIYELFGATSKMIVMPFVVEGALMGFISAIGAVALSFLVYVWQSQVLIDGLGFWGLQGLLGFLGAAKIVFLIFMGSVLGGLGSYLCVRQVSTGWAAAEK